MFHLSAINKTMLTFMFISFVCFSFNDDAFCSAEKHDYEKQDPKKPGIFSILRTIKHHFILLK